LLLLTLGVLISGVVTVSATTYIKCGATANTHYSTIHAEDKLEEQMPKAF